jgi:hypothetical protein
MPCIKLYPPGVKNENSIMQYTKTIRFYFEIIIALVLAGIVIGAFTRSCRPEPAYMQKKASNVPVFQQADTVFLKGDPYPVYIETKVPLPADTVYLTIPENVNYDSILKQFFVMLSYVDSLKRNDVSLKYRADISKNKLQKIDFWITNNRKTAIITNTYTHPEPDPKRKLLVGVLGGYGRNGFSAGGSILYQDKKDRTFQYLYDGFQDTHLGTVHAKLKF